VSTSPLKKYLNSPKKSLERLNERNDSLIPISMQPDVSKSFIDPLFDTENDGSAYLQELISDFNKNTEEFEVDEDNIDESREKAKDLIKGLFGIQEAYSSQFIGQVQLNRELKSLLVNYNEKYRTIVKKSNKLKETLETYDMKNHLCTNVNRDLNSKIQEKIDVTNKELNLFKSLFRISHNEEDVYRYTQMKKSEDLPKEKNLLLKVFQNLSKKKHLNNLDQDSIAIIQDLFTKYNILDEENEEEINQDEPVNKIILDDDDDEEEPVEINEQEPKIESPKSKDSPKKNNKRLTVLDSVVGDILDHKLDNYLVNYYSKKRHSQIPLRRISAGNYEFGSQKIHVKCEGETIRGILN
jgi:hypothetical protein